MTATRPSPTHCRPRHPNRHHPEDLAPLAAMAETADAYWRTRSAAAHRA
ncbi:hypothetical protein [Kitasatospora sp. NPDC001683]